jgi:biopolymer transport protein ExbD
VRKRAKAKDESITDVNMTPLIDVSLVLVVILLVATPMAFQSGIAVRHAAAAAAKAEMPSPADRVEIHVLAAGGLRVNREDVADAALPAVLQPKLAAGGGVVVVRCEAGVSHGRFVTVLDQARIAGAANIAVVGGIHAAVR